MVMVSAVLEQDLSAEEEEKAVSIFIELLLTRS